MPRKVYAVFIGLLLILSGSVLKDTTGPPTPTTLVQAASAQGPPAAAPAVPAAAPAPPSEKVLPGNYNPQSNDYDCGPTAGHNLATTMGHDLSVDALHALMNTTTDGTFSVHEFTAGLDKALGGPVYAPHDVDKNDTVAQTAAKLGPDLVTAVVNDHGAGVNVKGEWTDTNGDTHGPYKGHYIAVIGYTRNGIEIADSADPAHTRYSVTILELAKAVGDKGWSS